MLGCLRAVNARTPLGRLLRRPNERFLHVSPLARDATTRVAPTLDERPTVDVRVRFPKKYFDFKAFRLSLDKKKYQVANAEYREVRKAYALEAPEGWTVLTFLEKMNFGEGAEEVAAHFESWNEFISVDLKELRRVQMLTSQQRRRILQYVRLFNHGLWPKTRLAIEEAFPGKPLGREGELWTEEEDRELLKLCSADEGYDVNFGDPWIYVGYHLKRHPDEARDRYTDMVLKPLYQRSKCEIVLTRCTRPLLMNRKFRLLPPQLVVVPTFSVADRSFTLSDAFVKYRDVDNFR